MQQTRRMLGWLASGAFPIALALMLALVVPLMFALPGDGVVVAQSSDQDDDENSNENTSAPTPPTMPVTVPAPVPSPMSSPVPQTQQGSGTGTGTTTGTSAQPSQTGCAMPAANVTERRMFNLNRPSCLGPSQ
jgi:hypothetical protein